jgi:ankyrin repeat protein
MFDDEDHLESRTFPAIHKTVLGLVHSDLRQQLELSTATIDDKDADGRTALSWAAAKGDADAVKILLQFGANPNVCSRKGQSPLHWGGQNPSERCVEIIQALLDHGADVNLVDQWNRTVLVNAAADNGDPECLKRLVDAGADINWRDCHKRTSLGYAAKRGVARAVEFFLSRGADPHIPDHWGYTPLCEAVHENHHQVLRILLQVNGMITTAKTKEGKSILHIAALHGDIETLHALKDGRLEVLNPLERDNEGLSPRELFDSREDTDPALEEAFVALVSLGIRSDEGDDVELQLEEHSGDESESAFVDAVEHQVDEETE